MKPAYGVRTPGAPSNGIAADDYLCNDNGSDCGAGAANPIFALSLAGETPSSTITWYQAAQACANVGKRLPTTAEWQLAASGTPGGLNNDLLVGCNTDTLAVSLTGQAANCSSTAGASDMVGNLWERVAELDAPSNPVGSTFTTTDASIGRALGTDSEMGNLYYNVLGGIAGQDISTTHNSNYDLFSNVLSAPYLSATEFAPDPSSAWNFLFSGGGQFANEKGFPFYAWAVHSGDASVVPVPAAVWPFGSGLLGLIGIARRKKAA